MKQTIISKCFSKMKRVALTLFAALCVGNLWAAIAIDIKDMAFTEDGTLSFQYQLGYSESDSVRYAYLEVEVIDSADIVKRSEVLISKEDKLQLTNHGVLDWATATIENVGYTSLEALYADSCALRISFKAFKDGEDFSNEVYEAYLEPSGLTELEATYTVAVKEFIVYGKYDLNAGITGLDLSYALNDATLSNPTVQALTLNADGTFEYHIPYSTDADVLYFSVLVKKGETSVVHRNPESAFKIYEQGIYEGNATYTWTGASDNNIWANAANWTYEGDSRLGYPGLENKYHYYVSKICFNTDAEVDLNGQAYYLWDANRGFEMMTEGITVKLKNGTLGFQPHDDGSRTTLNFGKANSTLILNNLTMPFTVSKPNEWYSLKPVASSTVVVEGDKNYYWRFTPGNKNTKFKVKGGTVQSSYTSATPGSGSQLEIENGVYIVKTNAGSGLAATTTFRDGPDRQARLWLRNSSTGSTYYNLKLYGTYNIKIPETPYSNPYVLAKLLSANATCTMNIDVSDYKLGAKVPLIKFTGTLDANTKNAMKTMTTTASKLVVKANDVNVKSARNAKLVWDETAKILYFQQDSQNAAEVAGAEYATFAEAFAAAEDGATVKLLKDATLAEKITVKKAVTLDLNGCTLSETVTDSYGAIYIGTAGNLTITDSATGGKIATDGGIVVGNYGTVTVAGGTIEAGAVAQDDTSVYNFYYNGSTYGKLTVNGGKLGRIWNCGNANITAGTVGDIDNSGAMTIAEEAVIEDEEIILGNDAADVPNAGTIITSKTLNVSTFADDYVVEIVDGVYKLKYTKTYTVTLPAAPANTVWYCNGQEVTGPVYAEYGSNVTITLKPAEGCSFSDGAAELTVIEISAIGADTEVTLDNVTVPEAFQVVAKIGDTPYASLQAAYAAAEAESTIVLCKDVTGAGLVIDKSVTIDFGGNTYTFNDGVGNVPSNGFQILNGNTVTLKNGELNVDAGSADKFYTLIQNYANLTVEDMVLDGTNLDKWSKTDGDSYVLSNNSGTVLIQGATSITANDDGDLAYAFDVCKYKTYDAPTVTLNTTGTIAGKVEVSGGDFVIGDENTAEISAINFTAGSVKGNVEEVLAIPEDKKLVETDGVYTLADKDVIAKVGDKLFETIAEAFDAAKAGDTVVLEKSLAVNQVLQIPANVTLDLNGNELQALAVVGKLSMNGGALKTYDTNTQTYFFMAAPAGTAALYWTSDAVMTIGADYALSLDGGSVTLPNSWRSLLGQTLTIKSGATFVIPQGVELNLRGNAVVEDGATLTCEGTIALGNTYDAIDTSATLTSAQLAEGKVVSAVEGYRPVYANGVYSLEEIPAEFAAQVGAEKYPTLQAALDVEANLAATITLIANTKENITIPAGFTGTIDLGGFTLAGRIDSYATGAVLKNGSVIHTTGSKAAIQIEAGSLELTDINMESNYHGVRLNGAGATATINSGTYRITSSAGTYNLIYASKANAKFYVYGGEFYNNGDTGATWVLKAYASGAEINVYGGTFSAYSANTFEVANSGVIKVFGGTFTGCNPSATTHATVQPGYAVEGAGPWTVVASWTAPMPDLEDGDSFSGDYEYTSEVLSALEAKAATSVDVKVNGVELKGDEAIKALNTAVASFDDALTFDGTAASLDIEIKVTAVNTEDPAASTVVVKRGTDELTVKVAPTVKYFYPETKTWGSDKPESGAVLFKLVFEAK